MREEPEKSLLDKFCIEFCNIVEKYTQYIIVFGFVAISSGRTRGTEDIDMIIPSLEKNAFIKVHNDLIKNEFVCMQSDNSKEIYDNYLNNNLSVRYTYKDKALPEMEIKFSKDELDEYQLKTKTKLKITGLDI